MATVFKLFPHSSTDEGNFGYTAPTLNKYRSKGSLFVYPNLPGKSCLGAIEQKLLRECSWLLKENALEQAKAVFGKLCYLYFPLWWHNCYILEGPQFNSVQASKLHTIFKPMPTV